MSYTNKNTKSNPIKQTAMSSNTKTTKRKVDKSRVKKAAAARRRAATKI